MKKNSSIACINCWCGKCKNEKCQERQCKHCKDGDNICHGCSNKK